MKQQRGFTIIEVIIAVTIAGFLLAAALPSAGAWIRNSRIRTAAESMSVGLQQARAEAVRRNQPVGFFLVAGASDGLSFTSTCALSTASSGWVIDTSSPAGRCVSDLDKFIAVRPPGDATGGIAVAADGNEVTFNGFGQISNATPITCIKVSNAGDPSARALNVAVNAGGQVRMCDPAVSDINDPRVCLPRPPAVGCN